MAFEWETKDPIFEGQATALPWEADDPIVSSSDDTPSFRGAGATGSWEEGDSISIPARFGKQLTNIFSKSIKEIAFGVGGGKIASYVAASKINKTLRERGIEPPSLRETQKKFKQAVLGEYEKGVPEFDISPATTVGEKATDIAAGITGFVAQLAILKKTFPGVSGPALWEMENLSSGGTPGVGAATYGVFNLPGKVIKGVSVAAKAGRVGSESVLLGSLSAVHQKIETGEIQWTDVAISAGIPLALRVPAAAKKGLSKLIGRAVVEGKVSSQTATKVTGDILAKSKETGIPVETIVGNIELIRQAPKIISRFPQKIKNDKSLKEVGNAIAKHMGLGDWNITWSLTKKKGSAFGRARETGEKTANIDIKGATGELYFGMHKVTSTLAGGYKRRPGQVYRQTQAEVKRTIIHELGHLAKRPILKGGLRSRNALHHPEFVQWVDSKVKELFTKRPGKVLPKPEIPPGSNVYKTKSGRVVIEKPADIGTPQGTVMRDGRIYEAKKGGVELFPAPELSVSAIQRTPERPVEAQTLAERIQTTNQQLIDAITISKLLTSTEVKAAHKALRRRQVGRGIKATKAALRAGRPAGEAIRAGRRAYGGKSRVPKITPPDLTPAQWEGYNKKILEAYPLNKKRVQFQRTGAQEALDKLRAGDIPTNYEIGLLEPVLGTETATKLFEALQSKKGLELWDIPTLIRDVPKALRFGFDPQAARGLSKVTIRHPLVYISALGKNIRGIFSKNYTDVVSKTIEASGAYKLGQKEYGTNYLSMKPWASVGAGTKLEQYGHISEVFRRSNNRVIKGIGTWLRASERGANLGMNDALNKLVIKAEKDLARYSKNRTLSDKQIAAWRKARGHDINIYTKRITMKHPKGKAIQRAANWLVFSPSYTASGLASGPQSFLRLATGKGFASRTYAMQIMLSRLAGLTAASSAIGYVGHKWRLKNPTEEPPIDSSANPIDPLFGKVRQGLEVYDLGFGDVADYRLMARVGLSAYMGAKKLLTGKEITSIGGKKIPTAGESFGRYLESKRTLYISLAKQLATGKDWLGNSVTLKDTALDNLPFEFFQAFVEAGAADGLWESMAEGIDLDTAKKTLGNLAPAIAALGGVGTGSYPTYTYVTRSKFRDVIAEKEYTKRWDDLTQREQRKLSIRHRKAFAIFERKIKEERVEKPSSPVRIIEEQRKSGVKITKLLSKPNREKIKGVSVTVSRRPKNFYLNDERYQRYQELTAKYINERLSKLKLIGKSDRVRIKMLEVAVKMAKAKAFRDIRKTMR